jgi:hypothetical protein
LTIGVLTLSPSFDSDTIVYTADTTNATNTITATSTDEAATIAIDVGGTVVENGTAATWASGANVVTITVTNGTDETVYTVTVTKTA